MFTSSSTTLTLEPSSEPCCSVPRPLSPGVLVCAGPLAADSDHQVLAARLQAGGIHEVGQLQRADLRGRGLPRQLRADDAVGADGDALRTRGNGDARLHVVATGR